MRTPLARAQISTDSAKAERIFTIPATGLSPAQRECSAGGL